MAEVLNQPLYRQLKRLFRKVRISNEGEAAEYKPVHDSEGNPNLFFYHTGEYYQVCCPFCTDTRFRLYINHMYGKTDTFGRTMKFLAVCYNDTACMSRMENVDSLWDDLSAGDDDYLRQAPVKRGSTVPVVAQETTWPGPCIKLTDLPSSHKAVQYIESRGFDPDYIASRFDVRYCSDSHYFLCRDRLIIPVYDRNKLKGWQARFIGEWQKGMAPKYFTFPGMPRRSLIYNFDEAKDFETGIIVEGPTDVWSLGLMGVCTFGSTMTAIQARRFFSVFKRRTAVLLFDPEEFGKKGTQRLIRIFKTKMPERFAALKLPTGTDPGSLGRSFLRDFIHQEAWDQFRVRVSYKRVVR